MFSWNPYISDPMIIFNPICFKSNDYLERPLVSNPSFGNSYNLTPIFILESLFIPMFILESLLIPMFILNPNGFTLVIILNTYIFTHDYLESLNFQFHVFLESLHLQPHDYLESIVVIPWLFGIPILPIPCPHKTWQ